MEARISMALYQEKLLRDSSSDPVLVEHQNIKISKPTSTTEKV